MLKNNSEQETLSYTQILTDCLIAYNTIGIPKISEPTEQEQQQLDEIDINKISQKDLSKMSNRKLIHLQNTLNIDPKCFAYLMANFMTYFGLNVYMVMYVRKNSKKFYNKATGVYKQILIKGTLISSALFGGLLGVCYLIFKDQQLVQKNKFKAFIYEELVQRNSLYDAECRHALLENALKFYRFSPEFIDNAMNQIDDNLEKEFGDTPDLYLEPI